MGSPRNIRQRAHHHALWDADGCPSSLERNISAGDHDLDICFPCCGWSWNRSRFATLSFPTVSRSVQRHAHKQRVDYPLSSVLSAEKQPLGSRAVQVLTVFSFIGLGNYVSSIVFLILLRAFKAAVFNDAHALEWVWRLQLGLGMIPAALTLYSRLTISETRPYQQCNCLWLLSDTASTDAYVHRRF